MSPAAPTQSTEAVQAQIAPEPSRFTVLGVHVLNATRRQAIAAIEEAMICRDGRTRSVFFVNAHTLNLAAADPAYRDTLNTGDFVFADGTGIRWAARLQGVRIRENVPGTDFVPEMLRTLAEQGYSYFLLGADAMTIHAAGEYARRAFPGWRQAGIHHGYLTDDALTDEVIEQINFARPDVLLVGMGNPLQERWIERHRSRLEVPVCMGVGGLFDFWAGNVSRAPGWLRRIGHEWLWRFFQQPRHKAQRYLIGAPQFLGRAIRERYLECGNSLPLSDER